MFSRELRTSAVVLHESVLTTVQEERTAALWLMHPVLPSSGSWQCSGTPRAGGDLLSATPATTSGSNHWGQPCTGPPGAWEIHLGSHGWSFAGLKLEGSKQCFPWVGRGQCVSSHAQRAPLWQEKLRVSTGSSGSSGTLQQRPARLGFAPEPKKTPYALRDRDPQERLPPTSSAVIFPFSLCLTFLRPSFVTDY